MKNKGSRITAISFGVLVAINGLPDRGIANSQKNYDPLHHSTVCGTVDVRKGTSLPLFKGSNLGTGLVSKSEHSTRNKCLKCNGVDCGGISQIKDCFLTSTGCKQVGCQ